MKRKIITSLLALVIAFTALYVMPVTLATDDLPEYADGDELFKTQMFLGAWCEPEGTETQIQYFKDCGFKVAYFKEEQSYDGSMMYHQLELYEKYGLKAMLGVSSGRTNAISWRASKTSLDHPAILGLCSCDEPLGNGTTQYKDVDKTIIDYKMTTAMSWEKGQHTGWQKIYTYRPYPTVYDFLYYDGMTFLYGGDDADYALTSDSDVLATENLRTGRNRDGSTFQRVFTSVLSNRADEGTFGYEAMKSYCESIFTGKHDITRDEDDTVPVPVEDRFLEIDQYPYSINSRTGEIEVSSNYMNRLMEFRYYIDAYDIPMSNDYYQNWFPDAMLEYIDEGTITHQFYTIMSYGIKGLTVWYYNMYWSDYKTDNEVPINEYLQKTDLWYYNRDAFAEIEAFDNVYLAFCDDWQGIMTVNGTEYSTGGKGMFDAIDNNSYTFGRSFDNYEVFNYPGSSRTPAEAKAFAESYVSTHHLTSYPRINSVSSTGDTSIGVMKDKDGRDGFMITNQNFVIDRVSNTVEIVFNNANRVMMWQNGQKIVKDLVNGKLTLELGVGDGVFAIPLA